MAKIVPSAVLAEQEEVGQCGDHTGWGALSDGDCGPRLAAVPPWAEHLARVELSVFGPPLQPAPCVPQLREHLAGSILQI